MIFIYFLITVPKHQLKSIYGNNEKLSANRKSMENRNSPVHSNSNNKLSSKQHAAHQQVPNPPAKVKGPSIPHKPKPKNIEAGLAQLNMSELENMLATYKVSFANSHLVWLKGVSYIYLKKFSI